MALQLVPVHYWGQEIDSATVPDWEMVQGWEMVQDWELVQDWEMAPGWDMVQGWDYCLAVEMGVAEAMVEATVVAVGLVMDRDLDSVLDGTPVVE
jgi:hypothetical protein